MKAKNLRRVFGLTLVILLVLTNLAGLRTFANTCDNPYGDLEITKVVPNIEDDPTLFEFKIYSAGEHGELNEHCELVETVYVRIGKSNSFTSTRYVLCSRNT